MQIGQQILHLLLRYGLPEGGHHIAAGHDYLAHPLIVRGHTTLGQELFFENSLQAAPLLIARRVRLVAAIAILVIEAPSRGLLPIQPEFRISLAPGHVTATARHDRHDG